MLIWQRENLEKEILFGMHSLCAYRKAFGVKGFLFTHVISIDSSKRPPICLFMPMELCAYYDGQLCTQRFDLCDQLAKFDLKIELPFIPY